MVSDFHICKWNFAYLQVPAGCSHTVCGQAGFLQAGLLQVWPSQVSLLQQSQTLVPALAQVQQYLELHVEVPLCLAGVLAVVVGDMVRMAPTLDTADTDHSPVVAPVGRLAFAGMEHHSQVVQEMEEDVDTEGSPWALQDHPPLAAAGRSRRV